MGAGLCPLQTKLTDDLYFCHQGLFASCLLFGNTAQRKVRLMHSQCTMMYNLHKHVLCAVVDLFRLVDSTPLLTYHVHVQYMSDKLPRSCPNCSENPRMYSALHVLLTYVQGYKVHTSKTNTRVVVCKFNTLARKADTFIPSWSCFWFTKAFFVLNSSDKLQWKE